ncbi:hypothetical protein MYP_4778 [Sporocytophaga myxococcoides]|uniref:Uncharacterized protein n=1 Tax=Sporocytophaga myxococcoides TaxID=153721 RepID=A0A098LN37_9BACT|nr:hypothetical protein [Sporocytophaga myxococcoides]GAL87548.1 hypothetical protein MYP_4778 [Sporocytophaga myxococcoides]
MFIDKSRGLKYDPVGGASRQCPAIYKYSIPSGLWESLNQDLQDLRINRILVIPASWTSKTSDELNKGKILYVDLVLSEGEENSLQKY